MEWFNAVDATYRSDLRELNELNFARFDAKLEQRFAEQDAKWEKRAADRDAKWENTVSELDAKWERRLGEFRDGLNALKLELVRFKVDLVRWMFALWTGQLLALAGFVLAVLRFK